MRICDVPLLTVGRPGPTVLVYHGLGAQKETQQKELDSLARAGFFAVGVDAVGHGERRWSDLDERMARAPQATLLQLIAATAREIPGLVEGLRDRFGVNRFGITGISMGGYIAFASRLTDAPLEAAVPILGGPDWETPWGQAPDPSLVPHSPHLAPECFPPLALLAMNAGQDEHVPPGPTREFIGRLRPYYRDYPQRLEYWEYPHAGHFMEESDWDDLWGRTTGWFQRFLAEA